MARSRPPYPPEFRREAIRLVRASDEEPPIPRVAKELGVTAETLRNWLKQDEIDAGERLRKANAFFAREEIGGR
jgi:transposase